MLPVNTTDKAPRRFANGASKAKTAALALALAVSGVLIAPSSALAQCTPAARQALIQANQAIRANQDAVGNALGNMASVAVQNDGTNVMSLCTTQNFPTSFLGASQIVSNFARQIIDRACQQAISQAQQKLGPAINKMNSLQSQVGQIQNGQIP